MAAFHVQRGAMAVVRDDHDERLVRIEQVLERLRRETDALHTLTKHHAEETRRERARWDGVERRKTPRAPSR
jgi:hypothetical protein